MEGWSKIEDHRCPLVVGESTTTGSLARLGPAGQKTLRESSSVDEIKQCLLFSVFLFCFHTLSVQKINTGTLR